jgi:hypothetical protein
MTRFTVGAVSLLACALLPPRAGAAEEAVGVVAVAEPPGPGPELAELTHQLRLVVAERTPGVVDAAALRERMTGQTSSATLAELDRAYAGALATYQNGDFEGAVRTLRAVVQDLEKLPDGDEAFAQWNRAMLRLARSEQTLGRGAEAQALLDRLVRANPAVKADPNQYPPSFVKSVEDVKRTQAAAPKRKLVVNATAKGAKIFLEGRAVGVAPLTVEVPPGRYRVSGAMGTLRVPGQTVDLTEEGQTVNLNFALAESLRPSFGPGLALPEADRSRNLVAAGAWLGVDKLLATRLVTDGGVEYLSASFFDVRRGMLLREGRVRLANRVAPAGTLTALASFLITGQSSNLVAATATEPADAGKASLAAKPPDQKKKGVEVPKSAPGSAPGKKSPVLGWTAVGAAALSVGLAGYSIYSGMSAKGSYDDASALLQSDGALRQDASVAAYQQFVDDGDSKKSTAQVTGIAAAGCALTAGVLGYISYKQTGEIGPFRF